MVEYDLGLVVGSDGAKGDKGDKGDKGETGNGISSITLHSTSGKVKTYRVTYTNGATFDFQVSDGSDASVTVDSSLSSTSTNPVQNKVIDSALSGKASSSHSHSISDVTDLQTTLDGKASSSHNHNISDVNNLQSSLDGKANSSHTHTVSNITDFPSIPSKTSDLTNDGADGTNIFVSNNDNRLSDNRNPLLNQLSATSTNPLDLNDVTDTGFYALLSASSIQYVSNLPSDFGLVSFYLFTLKFNDTYIIQFIVSYNYAKSYVRVKMGNGWNAWRSYLSSDSVVDNLNSTSSTSVLSAKQGKVLADLIGDAITYINQ